MTILKNVSPRFISLAKRMLDNYGTTCEYITYSLPKIIDVDTEYPTTTDSFADDQSLTSDDRIEQRTSVKLFLRPAFRRRQSGSYIPRQNTEGYMSTTEKILPRPGDQVILPDGKRYPITDVRAIAPQGINILYQLSLTDG